MKRLYTLALSALVLAASATVAVPTAKIAKSKISGIRSERVEKTKATRQVEMPTRSISGVRSVTATPPEFSIKAQPATFAVGNATLSAANKLNVQTETARQLFTAKKSAKAVRNAAPRKAVPEGDWVKLEGKGKWFEGLIPDVYGFSPIGWSWEVDVEESATTPGYYRIQPGLEGSKLADAFGEADDAYFYINATDPQKVYVDGDVTYFGEVFSQYVTENDWNASEYGTLVDKVITFPAESFCFQDGEDWYLTNNDGYFKIGLPGSDIKDLGFAIQGTGICSASGKSTVYVSAGSDIKSLKYIATPGRFTSSEANANFVDVNGTVCEVIPGKEFNFTASGLYTVFFNAYDAEGTLVKCAATHFLVPEAENAEDWKVVEGYTAKLTDGMLAVAGVPEEELDIVLQESVSTPGLYRFEAPYANHSKLANSNVDHEGIHGHYIVINATRPDSVYLELSNLGLNLAGLGTPYGWSYGGISAANNNLAEVPAKFFGTKTETEITLPAGAALLLFNNEPYNSKVFNASMKVTLTPTATPEPSKAQFVDFDFVTKQYGIDNVRGGSAYFKTAEVDSADVKIKFESSKGNGYRFWNDGLRLYKGDNTITVTAPGHVISTIVLNTTDKIGTVQINAAEEVLPINGGQNVYNIGNVESATLAITVTDNKAISTMTVVLDGEPGETKTVEVENIGAFLQAADATCTTKITGDVTVTYQNGKYLFVQDATGSLEVYGQLDHTYTNGTKLSGIAGVYSMKNSMPQMSAKASAFTAGTEGDAVYPAEVTVEELGLGQYAQLIDVEITETDGKFYVGDVQIYDQFGLVKDGAVELKAAEKATVVGIGGIYNSTKEIFVTEVNYDGGSVTPDPVVPDPIDPAEIEGSYEWTASSLLENTSYLNEEITITVTDAATGTVSITGLSSYPFDFVLTGTYDAATGTLSIPNNQNLGDDENGDATYFYIKDVDTAGELIPGASDVAATVGTIENGVITFPETDVWAIGDASAEDLGWWTLTYKNVFTLIVDDPNFDPNKGWKSLGDATLMDGWVLPGFGIDQREASTWFAVELQQNEENENVYRLVDPYHNEDFMGVEVNENKKVGYIQFDVTDPDHVMFATDVAACFTLNQAGVSNIYCYNQLSAYCGKYELDAEVVISELGDKCPYTTFKDGVVKLRGKMITNEQTGEEGFENDACFGLSATPAFYGWKNDDKPANMDATIWFPGVTPGLGEEEQNSIKEVTVADGEEVYYNLRGQRISKPATPGLYIRNNQKVFVK